MSNDGDDLPFGLYERLVTAGLKARLLRFDSDTARIIKKELDPAEAHVILARHVANVLSCALNALPQEDRAVAQSELVNQIINSLAANPAEVGPRDDLVEIPPEELRSIEPLGTMPKERGVVAPLVALSVSDLLVNARGEPGLAHALAHEIPSADSIDLLCAFVRWHGLRLLEDQLEAHCRAGKRLPRDHNHIHRIHRTESRITTPYPLSVHARHTVDDSRRAPVSRRRRARAPVRSEFTDAHPSPARSCSTL